MTRSSRYVAISLILLLALGLRLYKLNEKPLSLDEDDSIVWGVSIYDGGYKELMLRDAHPPLFYAFAGLLMIFQSLLLVRVAMVLIGILSIVVLYVLTKKIFDERLALLSSFLVAILPMHVVYSQHVRPYILLSLIFLMTLVFLHRFIFLNDKKSVMYLAFLYVLSFYVDVNVTVFYVFSQLLTVLYFHHTKNLHVKNYLIAFVAVVVICAAWLPILIKQISYTLLQGHVANPTFTLSALPYPFYKFAVMANLKGVLPNFQWLLALFPLATLLVLFGCYKLYKSDRNRATFFFMTFFVQFIMAAALWVFIRIYSFRYFSYLSPIYVLFLSYGIFSIKNKLLRYALIGLIVIGWLIILQFYYSLVSAPKWEVLVGV